ncbi:hypothetical protein EMCRGX_G000254 [Ephydatia muelleri]
MRNEDRDTNFCGFPIHVMLIIILGSHDTSGDMASSNKVLVLEEKLCEAARDGNVQEIIRLLGQVADIDAAAKLDVWVPMTPLMWASLNGHMECVMVLLDIGAQVNMQNEVSAVKD